MTKYKRKFDIFQTETAELYKVTKKGIYSDTNTETIQIMSFSADVQPFSGGLASEQYGVTVNCVLKMFCDVSELLIGTAIAIGSDVPIGETELMKEGMYVNYDGKDYRITYIAHHQMGDAVLLEAVKC